MKTLTILGGHGKNGKPDALEALEIRCGELYTIVGHTGSGKSRLMKDIEQLVNGDSVTGRRVLLDGQAVALSERPAYASHLIAHLAQNMRFVLDISVEKFINLHCQCRQKQLKTMSVLQAANQITPEAITLKQSLNTLSGGQSRALMIADIACICDSPIVLIDEIENGGIDKIKSLEVLMRHDKLVLIVTHDPQIALMADTRLVLAGGRVSSVCQRTENEAQMYKKLAADYAGQQAIRAQLRQGVSW